MNRKIVYENVEPQMKVLAISELVFQGRVRSFDVISRVWK